MRRSQFSLSLSLSVCVSVCGRKYIFLQRRWQSRWVSFKMDMAAKGMHRSCGFLEFNERPTKPRTYGLTEIRGPYYSVMGHRYLQVISFALMTLYVAALHLYAICMIYDSASCILYVWWCMMHAVSVMVHALCVTLHGVFCMCDGAWCMLYVWRCMVVFCMWYLYVYMMLGSCRLGTVLRMWWYLLCRCYGYVVCSTSSS